MWAGERRTRPSMWTEETQAPALRPGRPPDPFRAPRPLCEVPAHTEPEEVEEEKDVGQEGHGRPLLQRGLHLPSALQPDPGRGSGAGRGPSLSARCCWAPGPLGSPSSTGRTCWPGGLSPSGAACSRPGGGPSPGPAAPPASALARLLRASLGLGLPCGLPRAPR